MKPGALAKAKALLSFLFTKVNKKESKKVRIALP
jgi:hypothetical protein